MSKSYALKTQVTTGAFIYRARQNFGRDRYVTGDPYMGLRILEGSVSGHPYLQAYMVTRSGMRFIEYCQAGMDEQPGHVLIALLRIYDAGEDKVDRYTVCFPFHNAGHGLSSALALGASLQGFSMHVTAIQGSHLGRQIYYPELPETHRRFVMDELNAYAKDIMELTAKEGIKLKIESGVLL